MIFGAIGGMLAQKAVGSIMGRFMGTGSTSKASSKGAQAYQQFTAQAQIQQEKMRNQQEMIKSWTQSRQNSFLYGPAANTGKT